MQLLQAEAEARPDTERMFAHPFLADAGRGAIESKSLAAPHVPVIEDATDTSNFDDDDEVDSEEEEESSFRAVDSEKDQLLKQRAADTKLYPNFDPV